MRTLAALLLASLLVAACSRHPKAPANLLPDSTYVHVIVELHLLKIYNRQQQPDSMTIDSLRQAIFKRYGTSQEQFEKSHYYYRQDVDQQTKRIKRAIEDLRKDHLVKRDSLSPQDSLQTHR